MQFHLLLFLLIRLVRPRRADAQHTCGPTFFVSVHYRHLDIPDLLVHGM